MHVILDLVIQSELKDWPQGEGVGGLYASYILSKL